MEKNYIDEYVTLACLALLSGLFGAGVYFTSFLMFRMVWAGMYSALFCTPLMAIYMYQLEVKQWQKKR